ncbi:MAG: nuclear transport factor 2 family protein [Thermoleophilaceae bacterium]
MSSRSATPEVSSDEAAVVAATLAYFNSWFDGDSDRMDRVLHPALAKRSLRQVDPDSGELRSVTQAQMVEWTAEGEGKSLDPGGERGIDVEVVDLYGNIASVVVRSPVYREYLHLVRGEDGWKIANALWHFT